MKQIVEYLLGKSKTEINNNYFYDFIQDIGNNSPDAEDVIENLKKMPIECSETLCEILCKLHNKGYETEFIKRGEHGSTLSGKTKKVELKYDMKTIFIQIYNIPSAKFGFIYVFLSEHEIDWYLDDDVDLIKLFNMHRIGATATLLNNKNCKGYMMFNELQKLDELKKIYDDVI